MRRRAGRRRPEDRSLSKELDGMGESWATARPRSVIVTVWPEAADATTADAFCLRARIPTWFMYYIVEQRRFVVDISAVLATC